VFVRVRRSRDRFWSDAVTSSREKEAAYQTLYEVLTTLTRLIAPFTPFVAEKLHEVLVRSQEGGAAESVHLEPWPERRSWLEQLSAAGRTEALRVVGGMELGRRIVALGRQVGGVDARGCAFEMPEFAEFLGRHRDLVRPAAAEDAQMMAKFDPAQNEIIALTPQEHAAFVTAAQPVLDRHRGTLDPKLFEYLR